MKKLLKAYNENRKKLIFTLLMLIVYDIIIVAKILFFLVIYLRIEITILVSLVINYYDEFINFEHFVSKT